MHPAWLRCKSSEYPDIPALSRLARQAPQHLKLRTYFCANPKCCAKFKSNKNYLAQHLSYTDIEYPVFELFAQLNMQIECQLMNILEFEKNPLF